MIASIPRPVARVVLFLVGLVLSAVTAIQVWIGERRRPKDTRDEKTVLSRPPQLDSTEWGEHKFVEANGLTFHYVERRPVARGGRKPQLVLCVHGFPESWYSWRHQLAGLGDEFHVVAVDMRGYGETSRPRGLAAYNLDNMVEDIRQLVPALGYEKCSLVSHDWGAVICWVVAITYPQLITSFVSMSIPHPRAYQRMSLAQVKRSLYIAMFQVPYFAEWLFTRKQCAIMRKIFLGRQSGVRRAGAMTADDIMVFRYLFSQPYAMTAALNYYRNLFTANVNWTAAQESKEPLRVRTLVLWGADDSACGVDLTEHLHEYVEDVRVVVYPNCSHWVQQDVPEEANDQIRTFLRAAPSSSE